MTATARRRYTVDLLAGRRAEAGRRGERGNDGVTPEGAALEESPWNNNFFF